MATQFDKFRDRNNLKLNLVEGAEFVGSYGFPKLRKTFYVPKTLIPFNFAKTEKEAGNKCVHFFIDDFQFERIWNAPNRYIKLLQRFEGVITPDFSMLDNMSEAQIIWNCYRNRALAFWLQAKGINIVPTVEWSDYRDLDWCLDGIPQNANIAIGTYGSLINARRRYGLFKAIERIVRDIEPNKIICYGPELKEISGLCKEVIFFENYCNIIKKRVK